MSGFEVVGLILGSVPLLISALEHYSDGVSTIKHMTDYETTFEEIHTPFVASLSIYRNSCEELLSPLMLPDNELYELLENPSTMSWKGKKLDETLRERLGPSYIPYKASVEKLHKKINLFAKKLKLGNSMRPPWIMENDIVDEKLRAQFFKSPWKNIKGGFAAGKYKKLGAEITSDIDQIASLTKGVTALEPLRLERKRRAITTHHCISTRDHARRIFEIFQSQWCCTCSCRSPHRASLRLDMLKDWKTETRFGFKFSFDPDSAETAALPWHWQDVEIEPLSTPGVIETLTASVQSSALQESVRGSANAMVILPSPFPPHPPSSQIAASAARIADLCEVLKQKTQANCCLGFLDNQPWQDHIYSVTPPSLQKDATQPATLAEIVHQGHNTFLGPREKYNSNGGLAAVSTDYLRCTLALTLASAVLQLHDTPWLSNSWNMKDILFIEKNTKATSPRGQPYVSKIFTPTSSEDSAISSPVCFIKNDMVFALGIALLELSWGKPISSFKTARDLDHQGNEVIYTEYSVASRLAQEIDQRELQNYADAARRCVNCSFDTRTYDLNDDRFRESFYQGVIVPLQADYNYVVHGP